MWVVPINVTDFVNAGLQHTIVLICNTPNKRCRLKYWIQKYSIATVHLKVNNRYDVMLIVMVALVHTKDVVP